MSEVAALRKRLQEEALDELGFGLSEDGHAWTLLVAPGPSQRPTSSDRIPAEALAAFLDDAVWEAWRIDCGLPPLRTSAERTGGARRPMLTTVTDMCGFFFAPALASGLLHQLLRRLQVEEVLFPPERAGALHR